MHFEESPSVTRLLELIEALPEGQATDAEEAAVYGAVDGSLLTDPQFILAGMDQLTPLLRVLGASQTPSAVAVLNRVAGAGDPFVDSRLVTLLARSLNEGQFEQTLLSDAEISPRLRSLVLLGARQAFPQSTRCAQAGLEAHHAETIRLAAQWAGEERLEGLRLDVEAALASEFTNSDLFLATVAALELLDGKSPQDFDKTPAGQYVLPLLRDEASPLAVRRVALRLADPSDEAIQELLLSWADHDDDDLRREVLRSMGEVADPRFASALLEIARDRREELNVRVIAIDSLATQLAADVDSPEIQDALRSLAVDNASPIELRRSAIRSLRNLVAMDADLQSLLESLGQAEPAFSEDVAVAINPPVDDTASQGSSDEVLVAFLNSAEHVGNGDAVAGERLFFHAMGPGCYRCHTVDGRGGSIGPDLSNIGRGMSREKLIDSILNPSREVAPQYTNWQMATVDGALHSGMIVLENEGKTAIGTAEGEIIELQTIEIEQRVPQSISVMPERLEGRMTRQEFLDLLAFLHALRGD